MKKAFVITAALTLLSLSGIAHAAAFNWIDTSAVNSGSTTGMIRNTSVYFDPNAAGTTIAGNLDISSLNTGGVIMFGLIDKKLSEQGGNTYQTGAYVYVSKLSTGVRIGTSDGNKGGEVCNNAKNVGNVNSVDFSMYLHANSMELTSSLFAGTKIQAYGITKTLSEYSDSLHKYTGVNNFYGYSWNEFEEGAYLGGDIYSTADNGASVGFNVSATGPIPVPEPSSFIALAGGLVGLLGLKRHRA